MKWIQEDVNASTTLDEVVELIEKLKKEVSLMACLGGIVYEGIEAWLMERGSSCHMTRQRSMFSRSIEIDFDHYVGCRTNTRLAIKGVGSVRF